MGRKKSNRKPKKPQSHQVPKNFDCEKCGNKRSIQIIIKKSKEKFGKKTAELNCQSCKEHWEYYNVKGQDEPIDVFSIYLEELEKRREAKRRNQLEDIKEDDEYNQGNKKEDDNFLDDNEDNEDDDENDDNNNLDSQRDNNNNNDSHQMSQENDDSANEDDSQNKIQEEQKNKDKKKKLQKNKDSRINNSSSNKQQAQQSSIPNFEVIDVVFCCNTTNNMQPYVKQIKNTVQNIMAMIREKNFDKSGISIKFGLVSYRDHPPKEESYITKYMDLGDDNDLLKFINGLDYYNGSGPDAALDGLMDAAKKIKWRENNSKSSIRYIFHICNQPPHGTQFGNQDQKWKEGCPCGITIEKLTKEIDQKNIHYRLIKVGDQVDDMSRIFKEKFSNFDQGSVKNPKYLDDKITDMIRNELISQDQQMDDLFSNEEDEK